MIPLTLGEIAAATSGAVATGDADRQVTGVCTDSRAATPGCLFVALRGERADGHAYIGEALAAGAAGYLAEGPVEGLAGGVSVDDTRRALAALAGEVRRRVDPLVVAVTGSVGKTTTKDLTAAALRASMPTVSAPASYNNELGVPLTLLQLEADTRALVTELGSRGRGHIRSLAALVRPDVAVVTAVAAAHLEQFGDLETVAAAKGELVEALPPGGTAVLNADDERVAAMTARTRARTVTFSRGGERAASGRPPDVRAHRVELDHLARPRFRVRTPWGEVEVRLPVAGAHQVGNALAALAVAGVAGADLEAAAAALADAPVSAWRGEVRETGGVVVLNDAYNANPASVRAALETLAALHRDGRRWAVLGEMAELGAAAADEHDRVGRLCARLGVDRLVVVGTAAGAIRRGAGLEGLPDAAIAWVPDADAAATLLVAEVEPGDAVLVKASRVAGLDRTAARLLAHLDGSGGR